MSDLRKRTQLLSSLEGAITAVQDRAIAQQNSVSQRLKWATGANPTLHNVLHEFEKAVRDRTTSYAVSDDVNVRKFVQSRSETPICYPKDIEGDIVWFLSIFSDFRIFFLQISHCHKVVCGDMESL